MNARLKLLLACAGMASAAFGWSALHQREQPTLVVAADVGSQDRASTSLQPLVAHAPAETRTERTSFADEGQQDTFATRDWQPPAPVQRPAPQASPPPPPPAPPPLTLPYRFIGLLDDPQAPKQRVFLAIGDKLLVASPGDSLEGGFRLESVAPHELVFIHLSDQLVLKLTVTGVPS